MTTPTAQSQPPLLGLSDVPSLPLEPHYAAWLDGVASDAIGPAAFVNRKRKELHGLFALAQLADRLEVGHVDMRTELLVHIRLNDVPVPCRTPGEHEVRIERGAVLALRWPEELLGGPIPGTAAVRILEPRDVFHSNVGPFGDRVPALCLGAQIARNTPLREMVLASYAALTLQAISLDEMDPAGVLHPEAAIHWQANASRIPLTTEPFLGWRRVRTPRVDDDGVVEDPAGKGRS